MSIYFYSWKPSLLKIQFFLGFFRNEERKCSLCSVLRWSACLTMWPNVLPMCCISHLRWLNCFSTCISGMRTHLSNFITQTRTILSLVCFIYSFHFFTFMIALEFRLVSILTFGYFLKGFRKCRSIKFISCLIMQSETCSDCMKSWGKMSEKEREMIFRDRHAILNRISWRNTLCNGSLLGYIYLCSRSYFSDKDTNCVCFSIILRGWIEMKCICLWVCCSFLWNIYTWRRVLNQDPSSRPPSV